MKYLEKWAVCTVSGNWLGLYDTLDEAKQSVDRCKDEPILHPLHVEFWCYPIKPDGTHGEPIKELVDD